MTGSSNKSDFVAEVGQVEVGVDWSFERVKPNNPDMLALYFLLHAVFYRGLVLVKKNAIQIKVMLLKDTIFYLQVNIGGDHFNFLRFVGYTIFLRQFFHQFEFLIVEHHPSCLR